MKILLTGDRPTGPLHLGHYVGSLLSRIEMQDKYDSFILIADTQALTDNVDNPEKIVSNVTEVMKDYLAVGLDPSKVTFFIQSCIPAITELTSYYMNLVSVSRLARNPTIKNEIAQRGFESNNIPAGFLCYPVSQAADITAFDADIVPVGEDQLPLIELCNEIVRKFNRIYGEKVLKEAKAHCSKTSRLIGIDGKQKASKSLGNAIFLSDDSESIKEKVFSMYTDPDHIKVSDSGKIEGNVVFSYLDAFFDDKAELDSMKSHYRKGGLGDMALKNLLNETLQKFIAPIRERRFEYSKDYIMDILSAGTKKACVKSDNVLQRVKAAIGISYF